MWSIKNDYNDLCARSRHQGQGQIITSRIICGMQLLVTRGRPVFAFTQVWNLPSLNWNHREKMVTTSANYLVETFEMFSHWSYVCWFYLVTWFILFRFWSWDDGHIEPARKGICVFTENSVQCLLVCYWSSATCGAFVETYMFVRFNHKYLYSA